MWYYHILLLNKPYSIQLEYSVRVPIAEEYYNLKIMGFNIMRENTFFTLFVLSYHSA